MPSARFESSGGAFGLYDDIPVGNLTIDVPVIGPVGATISKNSGLGNTLIGSVSTGGATVEAYYGPHGQIFDTNVSVDGAITAEFLGYEINLASIEISGNGFVIEIGGSHEYYSADNLSALTGDLTDGLGINQGVAESLTSALSGVIDTLEALEEAIQDLLEGLEPSSPAIVEIGEQNDDGMWESFGGAYRISWAINEEGDRLGAEDATAYTYTNDNGGTQGNGSITIYDDGDDTEAEDILVLEDVTADQVQFSQNADHDLVITMPNGETVTINNHFLQPLGSSYNAIELIMFSDGTVLEADEIADQLTTPGESISGTTGSDTLTDTNGSDTIDLGYGDDTIFYTSGDDVILGDSSHINGGNDTLDLSQYTADQVRFRIVDHDVIIDTPDGSIVLDYQVRYEVGHARSNIENIIFADGTLDEAAIAARAIVDQTSAGDDIVTGSYQADTISSGAGNDAISAGSGDDTIIYTSGDDLIVGDHTGYNYGNDTLDLSQYTASQVSFRIVGHDVFIDTPHGSIELDYQVRNEIGHARSNIENIIFSDGTLDDAAIRDRAIADQTSAGDDIVTGSYQADTISSGAGNDTIYADSGDDTIIYTSGEDVIIGNNTGYNYGTDTLDLSQYTADQVSFRIVGHDVFIDTPDGGIELDYQVRNELGHARSNIENIIFSDGTLDEAGIAARAIADQASFGDDVITGSFQSEVITGGTGNDTLSGVSGSDTFVFAAGDGDDIITDYDAANDALEFTGISFIDLTITQIGSDVLIEYGTGDQVTVTSSLVTDFGETEFLFA